MADRTRAERLAMDRDLLEAAMAEGDPKALPALVREHRAVMAELEALTPQAKAGDPLDEIAARRSARGGATARKRRPAANQG